MASAREGRVSSGQQRPQQQQRPGRFCESYLCHSVACLDRPGLEIGDKIIMPPSAFREAHRLRLSLPLLFKVVNTERVNGGVGPPPSQFCGVLEFSAPQDQVFMPYWMMQNLLLSEGGRVELRSIIRPPAGSFVCFRPHDEAFLEVAAQQGPKALMECALRRYSVLCEGVTILVQHERENFYLDVVEIRTRASLSSADAADANDDSDDTSASAHNVKPKFPTVESALAGGYVGLGGDGFEGGKDRRLRLVSLLGDIDLEVEFCSSRTTLSRRAGDILGADDYSKHESKSDLTGFSEGCSAQVERMRPPSIPSITSTTSSATVVERTSMLELGMRAGAGARREEAATIRILPPLPAQRKARDDQSATVSDRRRPKLGFLGIPPPAPPLSTNPLRSRCRAFPGKGVLLGTTGMSSEKNGGGVESIDRGKLRANEVEATMTNDADDQVEGAIREGEKLAGGKVLGRASLSTISASTNAVATARPLHCDDALQPGYGNIPFTAHPHSMGSITCKSCGKLVPAANYHLHMLRCSMSDGGLTRSGRRWQRRKPVAGRDTTEELCTAITTHGSDSGPVGCFPDPESPFSSPSDASNDTASNSVCDNHITKGILKDEVTRGSVNRPAAPIVESSSPHPYACVYCGLSFRHVEAIVDHDTFCGARTERCDRCCGLVSRRNAEFHLLPGGECDAAIAAAMVNEERMSASKASDTSTRRVAAQAGRGMVASSDGVAIDGDTRWLDGGCLPHAVSAVERMLAEAVRSSREAAVGVHTSRVRNNDLLAIKGCKVFQGGQRQIQSPCVSADEASFRDVQEEPRAVGGIDNDSMAPSGEYDGIHDGGNRGRHTGSSGREGVTALTRSLLDSELGHCRPTDCSGTRTPAEAPEASHKWTGPRCTLQNTPSDNLCEACGFACDRLACESAREHPSENGRANGNDNCRGATVSTASLDPGESVSSTERALTSASSVAERTGVGTTSRHIAPTMSALVVNNVSANCDAVSAVDPKHVESEKEAPSPVQSPLHLTPTQSTVARHAASSVSVVSRNSKMAQAALSTLSPGETTVMVVEEFEVEQPRSRRDRTSHIVEPSSMLSLLPARGMPIPLLSGSHNSLTRGRRAVKSNSDTDVLLPEYLRSRTVSAAPALVGPSAAPSTPDRWRISPILQCSFALKCAPPGEPRLPPRGLYMRSRALSSLPAGAGEQGSSRIGLGGNVLDSMNSVESSSSRTVTYSTAKPSDSRKRRSNISDRVQCRVPFPSPTRAQTTIKRSSENGHRSRGDRGRGGGGRGGQFGNFGAGRRLGGVRRARPKYSVNLQMLSPGLPLPVCDVSTPLGDDRVEIDTTSFSLENRAESGEIDLSQTRSSGIDSKEENFRKICFGNACSDKSDFDKNRSRKVAERGVVLREISPLANVEVGVADFAGRAEISCSRRDTIGLAGHLPHPPHDAGDRHRIRPTSGCITRSSERRSAGGEADLSRASHFQCAPACDTTLMVLGRSQANKPNYILQNADCCDGSRAAASKFNRSGDEVGDDASVCTAARASEGDGKWGGGDRRGGGAFWVGRPARVGIAPTKFRQRVSETRLFPLPDRGK